MVKIKTGNIEEKKEVLTKKGQEIETGMEKEQEKNLTEIRKDEENEKEKAVEWKEEKENDLKETRNQVVTGNDIGIVIVRVMGKIEGNGTKEKEIMEKVKDDEKIEKVIRTENGVIDQGGNMKVMIARLKENQKKGMMELAQMKEEKTKKEEEEEMR